jgi:hypothetical protein
LLKRSGPTDGKEGFIALAAIACITNANDGISIHAVAPKALNPGISGNIVTVEKPEITSSHPFRTEPFIKS